MSRVVVQAEHVGKRYTIRHQGRYGYVALRDVLSEGAARAIRRASGRSRAGERPGQEEFWALRDVSFQLRDGERLGLIGRNGAGKSTLLKILSRITEPSEGRVRLRGRVASLLEVGTGFHPELTGRENVYLNGTILGMRRSEIQRKFDEIVAFAEVERFLDTPVKRYSSGMYVRLAFAVAAHLEQEVLLVDEVLAVGDAAFQQKCLAKMGDVAREGRTIVLVSHNLVAIEQLCTTAIWLADGHIAASGEAHEIVERYNESFSSAASGGFRQAAITGDGKVELISYRVTNADGALFPLPVTGESIRIEIRLVVNERIEHPGAGISVWSPGGSLLTSVNTDHLGIDLEAWEPGERTVTLTLHDVPYLPGPHRGDVWIMAPGGHLYAHAEDALTFEVGQSALYGTNEITPGFGTVYTKIGVDSAAGSPAPDALATTAVAGAAGGPSGGA